MNAPPLIRPLRRLLLEQPQWAPTRRLRPHTLPGSTQVRTNASVTSVHAGATQTSNDTTSTGEGETTARPRYPLSLSTMYLKPLRREAQYGVPTCDLQLRSYTPRNLEFFCDFALRAAYYLDLPAFGPVPLPRITERWTVPKSSFIFKKSQENFERVTVRRLIQIRDGHPESVQIWLAFLRKHAYYGIGMKANVWEFSNLGVGKAMDEGVEDISKLMEKQWAHLGEGLPMKNVEKIEEFLAKERQRLAGGR